MKKSLTPPATAKPADFYFELSANGEQTTFQEVEGMSTHVVLKNSLKPGENPFRYRFPTPPKTGHLVLKKGRSQANSKLMQWTSGQPQEGSELAPKCTVALRLKDASGKSLLEWTFYSAQPVQNNAITTDSKSKEAEIQNLDLSYSFYTFSKL